MKNYWSHEDLQWLKDNSTKFTKKELAERLNTTEHSIRWQCSELKLKYIHAHRSNQWPKEDISFLINNSSSHTLEDIREYFNNRYTIKTIGKRITKLKLAFVSASADRWSEDDTKWLIENSSLYTLDELATKLNRTVSGIKGRCSVLKIKFKYNEMYWLTSEIDYLTKYSTQFTLDELVEHFSGKYNRMSVKSKIYSLGLKFKLDENYWSHEDLQWLKDNSYKYRLSELAKVLDRTKETIGVRCNDLGLKYKWHEHFIDYDEEYHCFLDNIDTEDKAWFIGWFVSDGHLSLETNTITFAITDREILEKFNKIFGVNKSIKERKNNHRNINNLMFGVSNQTGYRNDYKNLVLIIANHKQQFILMLMTS